MTTTEQHAHPGASSRLRRRWRRSLGYGRPDRLLLLALVVGTLVIGAGMVAAPDYVPITTIVVPMVLGSLLMGPRELPWFVILLMALLVLALPGVPAFTARVVVTVGTLFLTALIILLTSYRRTALGVAGVRGESMFVDLRDRILSQAGIPPLPAGWVGESAQRSAGGTLFAGDFVVASVSPDRRRLGIAVVDVSGKGEDAGTRALLLSGALGGLIRAIAPERFLEAANDYLLGHAWEEGFATAAHLSIDLETGAYLLRTAGHPPAVQLDAGTGRWRALDSQGPVLGLMPDAEFTTVRGTMRRGDAMLLYTDGLVETPKRDLELGIDRLVGRAEQLLRAGYEDGATRLIESMGSSDDDRACVLLHRR